MRRLRIVAHGGGGLELPSRSPAARWRMLLAAVALLGTGVACGSGSKDSYACTARCPGKDPSFYSACKASSLQDALNQGGCPAQTQCSTPNALCNSF